jgi:hypothetical protein
MKPTKILTRDLRKYRQLKNDETISKCIRDKNYNGIKNKKNCNTNQLYRLLELLDITLVQLVNKCIDDEYLLKSVVMNISILSSRQGKLDETYVIKEMNLNLEKIGINIRNNGNYTAIKEGKILKTKDVKNFSKLDCLKSFDGLVFNKKNEIIGYLFGKITYGEGGHQDNVFKEAYELCEWVRNFYSDNKLIFFIMIDTDLLKKMNELKNKFEKISNIFIGDHIEFQEFFINKKLI